MDICSLKIGDRYIKGESVFEIVVPFKPWKNNPKIFFGLSRYVGSTKHDA